MNQIAPDSVAVLYGAGVSYPAPTSLPLAQQFQQALWDAIVGSVRQKWEALPAPHPPKTWPQFEVFLNELASVRSGLIGQLLQPFRRTAPNVNHEFLAQLGKIGCSLVTTNFDRNVEVALQRHKARFRALTTVDDCRSPRGSPVEVLKLHGCISRPQSIVCCVRDLAPRGSHRSPILLSAPRITALRRLLANRTCFVVGYSGSDRLDILPALRSMTETTLVWVRHSADTSTPDINAISKRGCRASGARADWYDIHVNCDTTVFLASLLRLMGQPVRIEDAMLCVQPTIDLGRACMDLAPEDALLCLIRLLHESGQIRQVLRLLESALTHRLPGRVRFTLEENLIRLRDRGDEEVVSLRRLRRRLRNPVAPWISARLAYDVAYALDASGHYLDALKEAMSAVRHAVKADDRALEIEARLLECLILARTGRNAEAEQGYARILFPVKRRGNARHLAEAHTGIACLLAQRDVYGEARQHLEHAEALWSFCGDHGKALSARLNQANVLFHQERLAEGRRILRAVLRQVRGRADAADSYAHALLLLGHDECVRIGSWSQGVSHLAASVAIQLSSEAARHLSRDTLATLVLTERYLKEGTEGPDSKIPRTPSLLRKLADLRNRLASQAVK